MAIADLTPDEVRHHAPRLYEAIQQQALTQGHVRESDDMRALAHENQHLRQDRAALEARMGAYEAERNREQTAAFIERVARECGVADQRLVDHLVTRHNLAGAAVGERGTYRTPDELAAVVREAAHGLLAALPAGQGPAPQPRSGEIVGLGDRAATVREASASPRQRRGPNAVVLDGLGLVFGSGEAVREAAGQAGEAPTLNRTILEGLAASFRG